MTLRKLFDRADGFREEQWLHTSFIVASIINAAGPKRPVKPEDVNLYLQNKKAQEPGKSKMTRDKVMALGAFLGA